MVYPPFFGKERGVEPCVSSGLAEMKALSLLKDLLYQSSKFFCQALLSGVSKVFVSRHTSSARSKPLGFPWGFSGLVGA